MVAQEGLQIVGQAAGLGDGGVAVRVADVDVAGQIGVRDGQGCRAVAADGRRAGEESLGDTARELIEVDPVEDQVGERLGVAGQPGDRLARARQLARRRGQGVGVDLEDGIEVEAPLREQRQVVGVGAADARRHQPVPTPAPAPASPATRSFSRACSRLASSAASTTASARRPARSTRSPAAAHSRA